jgi:hypothetical protein
MRVVSYWLAKGSIAGKNQHGIAYKNLLLKLYRKRETAS